MSRSALLALAITVATAPALAAQSAPRRPKLPADADTNDAEAYYTWAARPNVDWGKKHDADYWAWRLEPHETGYLYALYLALWYRQPWQWRLEHEAGASYVVKSQAARRIDSVFVELLMRDPYPYLPYLCRLDEQVDRDQDKVYVGLVHWDNHCYDRANAAFGQALVKDPSLLVAHMYRARGFFFRRQYDSTVVELNTLLDSLRARDLAYLTQAYNSKAMLEYMVGLAHTKRRDWDAARAALGRALTEDLSFYPAHSALARLELEANHSAAAIAEYDLAVGLNGDDGVLRQDYGFALLELGDGAAAETQLREAVRLEPYWALPHFNLAVALARQGKRDEAIVEYEAFVVRCPRRLAPQAVQARSRIDALRKASPP
jgi:Tfp pilus assembly protein PilF